MKDHFVLCLLLCVGMWIGCTTEKPVKPLFQVTLTNPSNIDLPDYAVEVDLLPLDSSFILMDTAGNEIPIQLEDQNKNGIPDRMYFQSDIPSGRQITINAVAASGLSTEPGQKRVTIIANLKDGTKVDTITLNGQNPFRSDGIIWENDWMAYRLFTGENFPIDILAKNKSELIYDAITRNGNYTFSNEEDILDEHASLGLGTLAIYDLSEIIPISGCDRKEITILAEGPLMVSFRIIYRGIVVRGEKIDLSVVYRMEAGKEWTQAEAEIVSQTDLNVRFAFGLPKHPEAVDFIQGKTLTTQFVYTFGMQSVEEDQLGMALLFPEIYDADQYFDDPHNHFLLMTPVDNKVQYRFLAGWVRGRNVIADEAEFVEVLRENAQKYSANVEVKVQYLE